MIAEIITVGNEVLGGLVVNSNAAFLGERLTRIGCDVRWVTTVGDDERDIRQALDAAFGRADAVIMTGGLGPTHDDVTKKAVASWFGLDLVLRTEVLEKIEGVFRKMNRPMAASNRLQALVPDGAECIDNPVGQAPGLVLSRGRTALFVLPGIPSEMRPMVDASVVPRLVRGRTGESRCRMLRTFGVPESELSQCLDGFPEAFPEVRLGFFPDATGVKVRLLVFGESSDALDDRIGRAEAFVRERAGVWIYGNEGDTLESVLGKLLSERGRTIAVAESCTGGLVCHKLTNVPGSSAYFLFGVAAYQNRAKTDLLGVSESVLNAHGAVSPECAAAMAEGIRLRSRSDIGLSTTGIAGPGGGTADKPVGLVYIACADGRGTGIEKHLFARDRWWHKERAACAVLDMARRRLLESP